MPIKNAVKKWGLNTVYTSVQEKLDLKTIKNGGRPHEVVRYDLSQASYSYVFLIFFFIFFFFLIFPFCMTRMARTLARMTRMARMARWLAH